MSEIIDFFKTKLVLKFELQVAIYATYSLLVAIVLHVLLHVYAGFSSKGT